MEEKEKEVILDLSKKIKWNNHYISIGTLLLSGLILLVQLLMFLSLNDWVWEDYCWALLLNFLYSIRSGKLEEEK